MTKKEKNHGQMKTRAIIHLFMFSTLINGINSNGVYSRSHEMEISEGKRPENSGRSYWITHRINDNDPTCNDNVLVRTAFDKMLHWIFDKEVEKGGRSCGGRSLKFRLGERFAFRKRLQFALLPIMYKMGVMTTLLTGLTVLVLKGLTIGVILLIFAFGNYFTKLHKHSYHSPQPIHVHVHSQDGHSKVTSFPSGIGPWDRMTDEVHPGTYLTDDDVESYRRRLIQNSAAMVKFKPLL